MRAYDSAVALHRDYRELKIVGRGYLWNVQHRHIDGCEEVLYLRRCGSPQSSRLLGFRTKPGFAVPDGGMSSAGCVCDDRHRWLNLNEPGTVRAFVDVLEAGQWPVGDRRRMELDGWELFDEVCRRRGVEVPASPPIPAPASADVAD